VASSCDRSELVRFVIAGHVKGNEYSNNYGTEDVLKNNTRDVVFQISTREFRHAVNNVFL
jgi:hypothetical protein